jgi:hypothetical protein
MLLTDARTTATKKKIQAAVEAGLKARNVSGRRASLDVVGNDGLVRDIRAGVMPAVDRLAALMDYLGLGFQFGSEASAPSVEPLNIDGSDYTRIPVHEAVLSAGPGAINSDETIIDHLVFRADWLAKIGVSERNAAMARIKGDSMAPGIQSGDLVLIDTSRTQIPIRKRSKGGQSVPAIYAFVQDGEARVKRIERPDARLIVLLSDNPNYPPELVTEDMTEGLNILGRVAWSGHVWR